MKLRKNSKLGKMIYSEDIPLYEIEPFFEYLILKGYIESFDFYWESGCSTPNEHFEWDQSKDINKEVFKNLNTCVRKIKRYGNIIVGRDHLWIGDQGCDFGYYTSRDGFVDHSNIYTTENILSLYDQYLNTLSTHQDINVGSFMISSYGEWIKQLTIEEINEVYEQNYVPIITKTETDPNYYLDTLGRERMRDLLFSKIGRNWKELEHGLWVKKYYLEEDIAKQDIVDFWWEHEKYKLSRKPYNLTQKKLDQEKKKYDQESWSLPRLEEVYQNFKH